MAHTVKDKREAGATPSVKPDKTRYMLLVRIFKIKPFASVIKRTFTCYDGIFGLKDHPHPLKCITEI